MCATDKSSPIAASVRNTDNRSRKRLRSYLKVVNYFLKKLVKDQAITEFNAAILRYMQQANMTPQRYTEDLVAKSCKVADVYNKGTLNDVFLEEVDSSFRRNLSHY